MRIVFGLAGIALVLTSVVMIIMARKYKNPGAPPIPSFNPKHWVQPWMITEWYQPKGAKLYYTANTVLMVGMGMMVVSILFPA